MRKKFWFIEILSASILFSVASKEKKKHFSPMGGYAKKLSFSSFNFNL